MSNHNYDSAIKAIDIVLKKLSENTPLTFSDQCILMVSSVAMANDFDRHATSDYINEMSENTPVNRHPLIDKFIGNLPTSEQISFMEFGATLCGRRLDGSINQTICTNKNSQRIEKTYVIKKVGSEEIKIGRSIKPKARIRTLSCQSGCEMETLLIVDSNIELALHKKFSHIRGIGEWFDDSNNEIRDFINKGEQWIIEKLTGEWII